jgi:hypothetical protein
MFLQVEVTEVEWTCCIERLEIDWMPYVANVMMAARMLMLDWCMCSGMCLACGYETMPAPTGQSDYCQQLECL